MATVSYPSVENYMEAPFIFVPLNPKGQIVRRASATVEILYRKPEKERSSIGSIACRALHYFGSCLYGTAKLTKTLELDPSHPESDLEQQITRLCTEFPSAFRCTVLGADCYVSEASKITPSIERLTSAIQSLLKTNTIPVRPEHIKKLLLARQKALIVHLEQNRSIVCVSSKSPFFHDINPAQKEENGKERDLDDEFQKKSLASVRVFPNRSSSLTIPLLTRCQGGMKILSLEIYIGPDDSEISLMRRVKVQKHLRKSLGIRTKTLMTRLIRLSHPALLIPKVLYSHPKKGIEYLVENCRSDLRAVINPYTYIRNQGANLQDPKVKEIIDTPIKDQILKHLSYMKGIVAALKYLHSQDLLHNDLKPDNVLLNSQGDPILSDFDLSVTFKTGKLGKFGKVGTKAYMKPNTSDRNLQTELFALSRTFWIKNPDPLGKLTSFMDVFEFLHTKSKTKQPELTDKIASVIRTCKSLCRIMEEGTEVPYGTIFPTLERVITTIKEQEEKFVEP